MKRWIIFWLTVILCFSLGGCDMFHIKVEDNSKGEQPKEGSYLIYYMNVDETGLERDSFRPEKDDTESVVQEMLDRLDNEEPKDDMLALLPDDVNVNSYAIRRDTVVIDFNKNYRQMGAVREVLARAGIVKTLIQVPKIRNIEFTVNGEAVVDSQGDPVGEMNANTFVEYTGTDINNYQYTTLTLYFTNEAGDRLVPERRNVYYSSNLPLERVVMEQLLKGPREEGMQRTLPDDTNILGVTVSDNICYVNFGSSFLDNTLPVQENIPIYSIANSLIDSCGVKRVQISVEGDSKIIFRETMNLDQFYKKNTDLIQKEAAKEE
ncbi:MAG TPA: GerMN domain-containing protein [Candidatus Blautia intestinigallinarum]|nr:GerMN domain-containing protein [Candidatus Blautia intestinigallinarum]